MIRVLRRPSPLVLACLAVIAVLGVVVRGRNVVTHWDEDVVADVAGHRTAFVVDLARAITNLGDGLWLTLLLAVAVIALRAAGVLSLRAALAPLCSLGVGAALAPLAKAIVERPRPPLALHEVVERSSGFPSGHSTQAAAGWLALGLVLALAGRRDADGDGPPEDREGHAAAGATPDPSEPAERTIRAPAGVTPDRSEPAERIAAARTAPPLVRRWPLVVTALVVLLVGVSRVVLSVHSPTDVLAGWLLGLACAVTVVALLLRDPAPRR